MMKLSTCRTGLRLALLLALVAVGAAGAFAAEPSAAPQQSLITPDPSLSWLEPVELTKCPPKIWCCGGMLCTQNISCVIDKAPDPDCRPML